jgi:hypothetical protein
VKAVAIRVTQLTILGLLLCCGGGGPGQLDLCNCVPTAPESEDFRHNEKHVPVPNLPPQEITVATMLTWPQTPIPGPNQPRSGRELQVFHIAQAFVQRTYEVQSDCDIHLEIADSADKNAPRAIAEIPSDQEYCTVRQQYQAQMAARGFTIGTRFETSDVPFPVPVEIRGLAFEDDPHSTRGSAQVKTLWEIHPAVVNVIQ